ncbi:Pyruvate kinase [uncultured archaeon]|nr:Pyruvate kinase [uncultured archaeon]
MKRKTKIICTLGPSANDEKTLKELIANGMNLARFNMSHGNHEEHVKRLKILRKINPNIPLILDTKGPEIRTGLFKEKTILKQYNLVKITNKKIVGDSQKFYIDYPDLMKLNKGIHFRIADGLIDLKIIENNGKELTCLVQNGGAISSNKNVNLPGVHVKLPVFSKKDYEDIKFAVKNDFSFIAQSFVREANDIRLLRKLINEKIHIIAKIEDARAIENFDEILKEADAIMVARGDLGVQIPTYKVPLIQKQLIRKCNEAGKPVIVATQMLESMTMNPQPTRAEASDVANAVLDGADCVMLSGETANGKYPINAVKIMNEICREAEKNTISAKLPLFLDVGSTLAGAAAEIAEHLNARAIITPTERGFSARRVSRARPRQEIIALTRKDSTLKHLELVWGVFPHKINFPVLDEKSLSKAIDEAKKYNEVKKNDLIVITAGFPLGIEGSTNLIRVEMVK